MILTDKQILLLDISRLTRDARRRGLVSGRTLRAVLELAEGLMASHPNLSYTEVESLLHNVHKEFDADTVHVEYIHGDDCDCDCDD